MTKDYLLSVLADRTDMFHTYDGKRKLTEYLAKVVKSDSLQKRTLEVP